MKRRLAVVLLALAAALLLPARAASAHPLGNFTINTYTGLRVAPDAVSIDLVVDMAEIPTLQRKDDVDQAGYPERECGRLLQQVDLRVDDHRVDLLSQSSAITFPPGQAGLRTTRLECASTAPIHAPNAEHRVSFVNRNYTERAGWREITAVGDGATLLAADVPTRSGSNRLTSYPDDLLSSPLDQRAASLTVRPGGPAATDRISAGTGRASPLPRSVDRATQAFTSFVNRQHLTIGFALLAVGASLVLGAVHALAPGHGKTVMAAYLVGQRGTFRQAMAVATAVTVTHTAGVLALGIAISASAVVAPERLYPWLGAASGILLALIGAGILVRAVRASRRGPGRGRLQMRGLQESGDDHHHHDHEPGHTHTHSHGGKRHSHGPLDGEQPMTWRSLLAMGFVGGLLPSPSAVVVLLGAIALGRAWFGVLLVLVYGLGMAGTLTAAGLLLLRARRALDRRAARSSERLLHITARLVPTATAAFIVAVGLYLTARGVAQI